MNASLMRACYTAIYISLPCIAVGQALLPTSYHAVKNVPSPNAASLGTYGDIPLDYFTGAPGISIPLTSISYDGIAVPVSLSYHSSGIRVAEVPGWAGLGWDVVAGGQITRKVNWTSDEFYSRDPAVGPTLNRGYYFTSSQLDVTDWSSSANLINFTNPLSTTLIDGEPDEFTFNFAGYSGSFFRNEQGQWKVKSKDGIQLEIAEELDNSGTYTLYAVDAVSSNNESVASVFTKFTIRTPDGFYYQFGGHPDAIEFSRGRIDHASTGIPAEGGRNNKIVSNNWYLTKITNPSGSSVVFNYKRGKAIFQKQRVLDVIWDLQAILGNPSAISNGNLPGNASSDGIAITPSYLESIETPLVKMEFVRSKAVELGPEQTLLPTGPTDVVFFNRTLSVFWKDNNFTLNDPTTLPNFNQQLDSIKLYDKSSAVYNNGIKFYQRSNPAKRRTLDSIGLFDGQGNNYKYRFSYTNVDNLPNYEALKTDHWGFFNGSTEQTTTGTFNKEGNSYSLYGIINKITYPTGGTSEFTFEPASFSSVVKVDPNNAVQPVSTIVLTGVGGIRLKKIVNSAGYNSPPVITEYFYNTNFANGGTISSGILGAMPRYTDKVNFNNGNGGTICSGNFSLANMSGSNAEWIGQVKGGIVTYSEVTKKSGDGSFVVYKYTNHDNPVYRDEIALNYVNYAANITFQDNYRLSSNDLERGKLLSEESYNSAGVKVRDINYQYLNAAGRKQEFIKSIAKKILLVGSAEAGTCASLGINGGVRAWATKVYHYRNPLKSVVQRDYDGGQILTNIQTFAYDNYGNTIQETKQTSDSRVITTSTKYNSDPSLLSAAAADPEASALNNLFQNFGIKNYPVEQIITQVQTGTAPAGSDQITGGMIYKYDALKPVVRQVLALELNEPFNPVSYSPTPVYHFTYAHVNTSGNFTYDSRYKVQQTINALTAFPPGVPAKPLSVISNNNPTAYTWDYNLQYLTSKTSGASADQVAYTSFEGTYLVAGASEDNKGRWQFDKNKIVTDGITGEKCINFNGSSFGTNYVISDFNLVAGKKYILSWWSKGISLVIKNGMADISPPHFGTSEWKFNSVTITGSGAQVSLAIQPGSLVNSYLDEVRLLPEQAAMTSYTYDPATGNVTSITDERGNISKYEYDLMGRLIRIKDEQGNILKQNTYQYQGPNN